MIGAKLNDIFQLFFPETCVICTSTLTYHEKVVCLDCLTQLPLTFFTDQSGNEMEKTFYGRVPIEEATAVLQFVSGNFTQKLIHPLKYSNRQDVGIFLGDILAEEIRFSNRFKTIDLILPVPLHPKKLKQRGYNQVTKFGKCLSKTLKVPYSEEHLQRGVYKNTQTQKDRVHRIFADETFYVKKAESLEYKHILLIDDVVTTGATIEACWKAFESIPNLKISLAAMAFTY